MGFSFGLWPLVHGRGLDNDYGLRTAVIVAGLGLARTAGTVTDATFEAADICPVVSFTTTSKL